MTPADPRHYHSSPSPEEVRLGLLLAETGAAGRASRDPEERRRLAGLFRETEAALKEARSRRIIEGEDAKWRLEVAWPE